MHENRDRNRLSGIAVLCALALLLAGCVLQEKPIENREDRPAPTISFSSPAPSLQPEENATASPSPTISPEPTAEPSPTPEASNATTQGECTVSVNPKDAPGPFKAIASARFFNTEPAEVSIKCSAQEEAKQAEKHGAFYIAECSYSFVVEKKISTVTAHAGEISCATSVVVDVNSEFRKGWTFSPGDEDFTHNQSISNTTTRNYTISNSGSLTLTQITCTTDSGFTTLSCPSTLKPDETRPFTASFDFAGQTTGQKSIVMIVREKDIEKTIYVTATLVN